ncbi:MAG: tetratricopeptide repeat protein [Pseudomonadota bacterium]
MALNLKRTITATPLMLALGMGALAVNTTARAASDSSTSTTPTCKASMVWDKRKRKCVKAKSSSLSDDNIYEAARDLAYHNRHEEALTLLAMADNKSDPRILNYMGYSTRKLGRIEEGLTYYRAALKADPDYTLVREYMGEAFLQLGQVDKAREQLAEIEKRCGTDCREYALLKTEIDRYVK